MARPDTVIWVFDRRGDLIYNADNSNVTDEEPNPSLSGTGLTNPLQGSAGQSDPYLGPIQLDDGRQPDVLRGGDGAWP